MRMGSKSPSPCPGHRAALLLLAAPASCSHLSIPDPTPRDGLDPLALATSTHSRLLRLARRPQVSPDPSARAGTPDLCLSFQAPPAVRGGPGSKRPLAPSPATPRTPGSTPSSAWRGEGASVSVPAQPKHPRPHTACPAPPGDKGSGTGKPRTARVGAIPMRR